ncbi:MAG: hypothetical protein NW208_15185, partial [Bryobacter sp.]|nr:hypothetical protein [Bryobacter sp.]
MAVLNPRRKAASAFRCLGILVFAVWPPILVAQPDDPNALLAEAERLYWLDNWAKSRPLYEKAEALFEANGDLR